MIDQLGHQVHDDLSWVPRQWCRALRRCGPRGGAEQVRLLCEVIGRVGIEVKQLQRTAHVSVHATPFDGPRLLPGCGARSG